MKKKILPNLLFLLLSLVMISCNDDNTDLGFDSKQSIIMSKYPTAQNLNWSKSPDNKYDIAHFTLPRTRNTAGIADTVSIWFGTNNSIRLVKEEISFASLPAEVKASFAREICRPVNGISNEALLFTHYANTQLWEVDDVYLIEKDGALTYRLEMETTSSVKPEAEVVLVYDAQGILLREYEVMDFEDIRPLEIPVYISEWIDAHFPGSTVLDYEMDRDDDEIEHELDLLLDNIIIEVELLEKGGVLIVEEIEFNFPHLNALPLAIQDVVTEIIANLNGFTIDDICEIEMEIKENGDEEYEIELRNGNRKHEITIIRNTDGVISVK